MVTYSFLATVVTTMFLLSRSRDHGTLQAANVIAHPLARVHSTTNDTLARLSITLASRTSSVRKKVQEVQRATGRQPSDRRQLRSSDPTYKYKEVTGRRAKIQWWHRVRALVVLAIIVIGLGIALAVSIGLVFLGGLLLLETIA